MKKGLLGQVARSLVFLISASNLAPAQTAFSCAREGSLKSQSSTTLITPAFSNQTSGVVSIYWLDFSGKRVFYFMIAPGATQRFETFPTHPWMVVDASGKCLGIYIFAASGETAVINDNQGGSQADLQTSVSSLSFSTNAGGGPAGSQSLSVLSSAAKAVSFAVVTDGGQPGSPSPPWLHVSPTDGMTPGRITVTADPGALGAAQYSARIAITIPGSSVSPLYVPVTLTVKTGSPKLDVVPSFLNFAAHAQSAGTLDQPLLVRNSGAGGPLGFSVAVVSGGSWLSVGAASGQTSANASTVVHVQANARGLKVGGYHGSIRVTASTNSLDVPVELFVANSGSILGLNITAVRFQSRQGNGTSTVQNVRVLNLGDSGSTINWTAQVVLGSEILDLGVTGGTATPQAPGILPMKPSAASAGRPAGGYYALVKVFDPQALNSPQYITAVLDEADSGTLPKPDPAPQGLVFIAAAGGAVPPAQSITINVDSVVPIAFQASASTTGGTWLSTTPATGTTSVTATTPPAQVSAMVNQHGLTAGIYTGEVDIAVANSLRAVNVTLIVVPGGSSSTALARAPLATGSAACAPSKLALTQTGLVNNFSVPAGWPAALIVQLNDDCGNVVPGGSVTASFSNGDPPLMLRGDSSGDYSATWQPGSVTPQIDITLDAEAVNLQPSTFHLIGGINQNQNAPPRLSNNGIVNVFDRVPAGAVAPGMIVEVYSSGLAGANGNPGSLPLPNSFQGTSMIVGAYQLPVYFVSGGPAGRPDRSRVAAQSAVPDSRELQRSFITTRDD